MNVTFTFDLNRVKVNQKAKCLG